MNVQILLDNNDISEYTFIDKGMNTLGYDSINEVFFDVFEIKSNNLELVKEKKGIFDGNPIIEVDIKIKNEIFKNVRFVLTKEQGIKINPNLLDYTKVVIYENKNNAKIKPSLKPVVEIKPKIITEEKKVPKPKSIIKEQSLIEKTKEDFFNSIKGEVLEEIKREIKAGIIADLIKDNLQSNFDVILTGDHNKNKLHRIIESFNNTFRRDYIELAEKISKREAVRYSESGGGTNAVQYSDGGVMNGDLTVHGKFKSDSMTVDSINVDSLSVNTLSTNNEFVIHNLSVSEGITAQNIDVDTLKVRSLSTDYEFIVHNLTVTEGITANNVLLYDSLSTGKNIYSNYGEFYDLTVNNSLSVHNNAYIYGTLSADSVIGNYFTINQDLSVSQNLLANNATINNNLVTNSLTASNAVVSDTLTVSSFVADYGTINHNLSVNDNLITNYETVNNDLSVLGKLYADQAAITNNLTIGGGISSYNGSYILGDVIVTGNLTVSQEIFGDLVSGNTIVNSSGDTLLAKAVKNISGSSFVNGNYTVHHNLSTYDLLMTLYYVNPNGTREVVHASMINDTLSTTQISFGSQPESSDQYKLVIMS
jgi:hypothetical protein